MEGVELNSEVIHMVKVRSNADSMIYSQLHHIYSEDEILKIMETIHTVK